MSKSSFNKILSGSAWGILAKIFDALAKFVTIPMLVAYFGKADYGLIALAFSLNAYLRLMDMGMNIGSIRFFSMWIAKDEWEKIAKVSRSSIVFYGSIGLFNASIFIFMAYNASSFFNLSEAQQPVFHWMMYVLAFSAVINWPSNVVSQLLNAHGEQGWTNRIMVISSIFNFITAFIAVKLNLSLPVYFLLYILSTLMAIPFNVYKLRVYNTPILSLLSPKWNKVAFKEVLNYSLAILAMGIFQFSADSLRPLLLGHYASKGIEVLTEYRVIQTITALVIAFGAVFMQVLLPSATKVYTENNQEKLEQLVYKGTKYISVFLCLVVFLLIVNAQGILNLYMGKSYGEMSIWLIIWLLTVLFSMHNSPVASLVLSTGKTKFLVVSSAVACIISLPITILLAPIYNVGAAVIGYFVYVLLQISFYYFYYIPRILNLNGRIIFFKSFIPSVIVGILSSISVIIVNHFIKIKNGYLTLAIHSIVFFIIYGIFTVAYIIKPHEIKMLRAKFLKG